MFLTVRNAIIALALSFFAGNVGAAGLPVLGNPLQGKQDPVVVDLPEPADLQSNWWRYFDVSGEKLREHVQLTIERLDQLSGEIPESVRSAARPLIERTKVNLLALPQADARPSPEPPAPLAIAESYTLEQLLTVQERLRKARDELQAERDDVIAAGATIKAAQQRIDTMLAAYLRLSSSDPDRVLRGLELLAERSAIAVAEEKLRVDRAAVAAEEVRVRQLTDELSVASTRVTGTRADRAQVEEEIKQAEAKLTAASQRYVAERSRALDVLSESDEDKAAALYRQQRVVQAAVVEAIAKVRLDILKAQEGLLSFLLGTLRVDTDAMRESLATWSAELSEVSKQAVAWTRDSARERDRAADVIAQAADQGATLSPTQLINDERISLAQETLVTLQQLSSVIEQAQLMVNLVEVQLTQREGWLRDWLARAERALAQLWDTSTGWITASLFKVGDTPVTALGILRIVLILFVAWLISYWLRRVLARLGERREGANLSALYTIGRLSHYVIIIIGIIVGLSSIGIDFTNFALVAGALSIGIGFGLQSIVNNFVSGLILLFERSLKVGDFVELASGVAGEVREINVRSTLVNTNDYLDLVVPNSEFVNGTVTNWTLLDAYCRIHIPFKTAFGMDKEVVRRAGLEAAEKVPHTLTGVPGRNPGVWLVGFGDSCLNFELVVWITPRAVKRPGAVHAAYMWELESALRKHGVNIPYPQRDLHLRTGFKDALQPAPLHVAGGEAAPTTPRALGVHAHPERLSGREKT